MVLICGRGFLKASLNSLFALTGQTDKTSLTEYTFLQCSNLQRRKEMYNVVDNGYWKELASDRSQMIGG